MRNYHAGRLWSPVLLMVCCVAFGAPTVSQTDGAVTVSNAHLSATFSAAQGGALTELRTASGEPVATGSFLYTDHGVYEEGVFVGTTRAAGRLEVAQEGGEVTVTATGTLAGADGALPQQPGKMDYRLDYLIGDGPQVRVTWTATPRFDRDVKGGFWAYVLSLGRCVGLIANTLDGVLLQDMATEGGRSFQSAQQPLSREDPWFGLMRPDGSVVAFTDFQGTPPVDNAFMHEDGKGAGSVFFAWPGAGGLRNGEPWTGGVTVRLQASLEALGTR